MITARAVRRPILDAACIGIFVAASFVVLVLTALAPRDPASGVAVIYAPWTSSEAAFNGVAAAGGRIVRSGGFPFIVIALPGSADFAARVRAAGAWLLADPVKLAACFGAAANGGRP